MRPSRTSWENKTLEISIYLLQCLDHICRKKNRMCEMIGRRTPTGSLMVLNYYFFYCNVALSSDIKEPLSLRYILTYL